MSNITTALLRPGIVTKTPPLYQYDYGQVLQFTGAELPDVYEVHFSNSSHGEATTMIGGPNGVTIPDMYLTTGADVYVWLYLHTGNADGETEYNVIIPVIHRASISDAPPTPVQQDVITQAIAALNDAVEQTALDVVQAGNDAARAETAAQNSEANRDAAISAKNAAESAQNSAKGYAQAAEASAQNASGKAQEAAQSASAAAVSADRAEQAATTAGYMWIGIDSSGHLIYERTDQVDADFSIDAYGHLIMEAI